MIWSVSTSERSSGTARRSTGCTTASTGRALISQDVRSQVVGGGEVAGDGGGGGDGGGDEVGAPAAALAALEVAVRRGRRSARRAPACRGSWPGTSSSPARASRSRRRVKTSSRPSASACCLHRGTSRARRASARRRRHLAAVGHGGRGPQVLDAAVGARADEHGVDGDVADRRAGVEAHVLERPRGRLAVASARRRRRGRARRRRSATTWAGFVPHETWGRSSRASRTTSLSKAASSSVRSVRQSSSAASHAAPLRRVGAALEVGERGVVGRDQPGPGAGLDRHVADRHAALHRERRGWPSRGTR